MAGSVETQQATAAVVGVEKAVAMVERSTTGRAGRGAGKSARVPL